MTSLHDYRRGLLLVLLGSTSSSTIGLAVRMMEAATAWQILFYRSMALAVFLLILIGFRSRGHIVGVIRGANIPTVLGGIALTAGSFGIIVAIQQTSVANAMFLFASAPFLAAILGYVILKESVRPGTWIAIVCAFAGIGVMVAETLSLGVVWGNVAGFASALGFALFVIALRWGRVGDMMPTVFFAGLFGTIAAGALCQMTGVGIVVPTHDALLALAMGVFQVGLTLVLYTVGSKSVPAAELSLLSMAEVLLAPIWVWLFLGEQAGPYTLLGGAILLCAIAVDALSGLRRRDSHPQANTN